MDVIFQENGVVARLLEIQNEINISTLHKFKHPAYVSFFENQLIGAGSLLIAKIAWWRK